MKNSTSLSIACSGEISVCGGMGGRGFEHLSGVAGGLLYSLNESLWNEGTTWSSSAGLDAEEFAVQDSVRWVGRDFFGGNLCELGLCLCPNKKNKKT